MKTLCQTLAIAAALFATVSPAQTAARIALPNSVTGRTLAAQSLGHLPGETALTGMSLILRRTPQQEAALDQLLHDQQDPSSPHYQQWLTPQAFGAQFGPSKEDLAAVQQWLQTRGLTVQEVAPSRNRIVFSGTSSAVENAFAVSMQRYTRDDQTFFENSSAVTLPASIASVVSGVTGLSSYRLTPSGSIHRALPAAEPAATVAPQHSTTNAGVHYLVPWDFRQLFNMNTLIGAGNDGTGIKIGVIGQSAVDTNQLTYFQQKTGQLTKLPNFVLVPNTGLANRINGDEGESELDLEYASGTAPGASVQFIYTGCGTTTSGTPLANASTCNNDGVFQALSYAITSNLAPILTLSYGGCEASNAAYANAMLEPILKQANAQGQTVIVSSGDSGAASCDRNVAAASHGLAVSYPASSSYVTAIGGTQLLDSGNWSSTNNSFGGSALSYISETVWNDSATYGVLASSGGGVSKIFPKPDWQVGNNVPQDNFRDVPDISFPASVLHTPYLVCDATAPCQSGSGFGGVTAGQTNGGLVGGTSASAPNFAAMLAVIEQANGGSSLGNINPRLYALAQGSTAATIFHDTITGDNQVRCVSGSTDCQAGASMGYSAGVGYDQATGLGSMDAVAFSASFAAKAATIQIEVSPASPIVGQPVTFTAKVLGNSTTPTGSITFSLNGTALSTPVALVSGVASYQYAGFRQALKWSGGPSTLSAAYSGDTTYNSANSSATVSQIQVPATVTVAVAPSPITTNIAETITVTMSGAYGVPTGYAQLLIDGQAVTNPNLLPLTNGVATYSYTGFANAGLHTITASYYNPGDALTTAGTTPPPNLPYSGGASTLNVQVGAPTQTIKPVVTFFGVPSQPLAPLDLLTGGIAFSHAGSFSLTGTYTLTVDGVSSTSPVNNNPTLGFAQVPASGWALGMHTLSVVYNGDNNYLPSAPATATFTVVAPTFTLSASPATLTIPHDSSGSITVTVNAGITYSGSTSFKLGILSYTGAAFTGCFRASPVTSARNTPVTTTLTMVSGTAGCTATNIIPVALAANAAPPLPPSALPYQSVPLHPSLWIAASASLLGLFTFRRKLRPGTLVLVLLTLFLFTTAGCGGGSSNTASTTTGTGTSTGTGSTGNTQPGTYALQIIGSNTSNNTITATTTFTLVVQ